MGKSTTYTHHTTSHYITITTTIIIITTISQLRLFLRTYPLQVAAPPRVLRVAWD
jgi:hypothetical protein